ncbi:MAG TPA: amidohydrolase family protein [Steroidobacteraceae bacterium]
MTKIMFGLSSVLTALLMSFSVGANPAPSLDQYDVVIRGGRVFDGTGNPWRYADLAIKGDRIVVVGFVPADAIAKTIVDAKGKYVAPGFIDAHSHAAPGITTKELAPAASILTQGITTALINPDGGGPADLRPEVAAIEENVPGINVIPQIGHNAVRTAVMGVADRKPTPDEQRRMEELVREAMQYGAGGLSSGPFYVPGKYSDTEEIVGLAKIAALFPGAWYTSHIRDESNYEVGLLGAVDEVIRISREAKLPGIVDHIKALGPGVWGKSKEVIDHINAARAEGLEIWADQYPYEASGSALQPSLVPGWAQEGGGQSLAKRLQDPQQRSRIRAEMVDNLARRGGANSIMISHYSPDPSLEGKRLDEIAKQRRQDPLDTAIDMLIKGGAAIVSFNMKEADIEAFMQQPWTMTCTDGALVKFGEGSEHPRAYGSYPRKLRRYVLERHVITMEQAIHSMTGLAAAAFRIKDRGELRVGAFADVLVIDPKTVTDVATYERPHAYSKGMDYVFVNGKAAIAGGKLEPGRFGRVILRGGNESQH